MKRSKETLNLTEILAPIPDKHKALFTPFLTHGANHIDSKGNNLLLRYLQFAKDPCPFAITNFLKEGNDVNIVGQLGYTPLVRACLKMNCFAMAPVLEVLI